MADSKLNIIVGVTDKATGGLKKIGGGIAGMGKAAAVGLGGAVAGIAGVGLAINKLASDAAPLEGISKAFEGVTADIAGGSEAMLKALQEGSLGMVDNAALMENFNNAAMLVSKDFAQELPEAMQYLAKVSAATGQDLDYLMSSLTTGVGRLSAPILDNLAIQVDAAAASEAWADSMGITTDEMTKQQHQMALFDQVMAKLKENTEDMPDITDNLATKQAQLAAKMKNAKDQIGLALIPVMSELMSSFADLANEYMPKVQKFIVSNLLPAIREIGPVFSGVAKGIGQAVKIIIGIIKTLANIFQWDEQLHPSEFIDGFFSFPPAVQKAIEKITGILSKLAWFVKDTLIPAVKEFAAWLGEALPEAIRILAGFWDGVLYPAFQGVWSFVQDKLLPIIGGLFGKFQDDLPGALQQSSNFFTDVLMPAIQTVIDFFTGTLIPTIQSVIAWIQENGPKIATAISTAFSTIIAVAGPIIAEVGGFIIEQLGVIIAWVQENWPLIKEAIADTLGTIQTIVETVLGAISAFWADHGSTIMSMVGAIWNTIKIIIETAINVILETIRIILLIIAGHWDEAWAAIKVAVATVWDGIKRVVKTAAEGLATVVKAAIEKIPGIIESIGQALYNAGKAIIEKLKQGLADALEGVKNWFGDRVQDLVDLLPGSEPKDPTSPLRGLSRRGRAIGENLLAGLNQSMPRLQAELAGGLAGSGNGGPSYYRNNWTGGATHIYDREAMALHQEAQRRQTRRNVARGM